MTQFSPQQPDIDIIGSVSRGYSFFASKKEHEENMLLMAERLKGMQQQNEFNQIDQAFQQLQQQAAAPYVVSNEINKAIKAEADARTATNQANLSTNTLQADIETKWSMRDEQLTDTEKKQAEYKEWQNFSKTRELENDAKGWQAVIDIAARQNEAKRYANPEALDAMNAAKFAEDQSKISAAHQAALSNKASEIKVLSDASKMFRDSISVDKEAINSIYSDIPVGQLPNGNQTQAINFYQDRIKKAGESFGQLWGLEPQAAELLVKNELDTGELAKTGLLPHTLSPLMKDVVSSAPPTGLTIKGQTEYYEAVASGKPGAVLDVVQKAENHEDESVKEDLRLMSNTIWFGTYQNEMGKKYTDRTVKNSIISARKNNLSALLQTPPASKNGFVAVVNPKTGERKFIDRGELPTVIKNWRLSPDVLNDLGLSSVIGWQEMTNPKDNVSSAKENALNSVR